MGTSDIGKMFSQVFRFTLPKPETISSSAFTELRRAAVQAGAVSQYFGYTTPTSFSPLPRHRHEVCWVVNWPSDADRIQITQGLESISSGDATMLLCEFDKSDFSKVTKALESRVCEFAVIRLSDNAPLTDKALQTSMHKTYTDAYKLTGFTGGNWSYALNTNSSGGALCNPAEKMVPEGERRLGVYFLGWESIELHEDGTKEEAFLEEIRNLGKWFGEGTGAWYAMLKKHEEGI